MLPLSTWKENDLVYVLSFLFRVCRIHIKINALLPIYRLSSSKYNDFQFYIVIYIYQTMSWLSACKYKDFIMFHNGNWYFCTVYLSTDSKYKDLSVSYQDLYLSLYICVGYSVLYMKIKNLFNWIYISLNVS